MNRRVFVMCVVFQPKSIDILLISLKKTTKKTNKKKKHIVGTHLKYLSDALLMNTHNICFREAIASRLV